MKHLVLVFLGVAFSSIGFADGYIQCKGKSEALKKDVKVMVNLESGKADLEVLGEEGFKDTLDVQPTWDGHMTGLVTGDSFALKYESHYGCNRNIVIFANIRKGIGYIDMIKVPFCSGGTSPDSVCNR